MAGYNILEWSDSFEKNKGKVDPKKDFLESNSRVLYPGRFYVLEYRATTKEMYNARPVIISIGISKKDPDSFLCLDLSVIPINARKKFIEMFFKIYEREISENINKYPSVVDADKQTWLRNFSYDNICKAVPMLPIKNAIKRYKIENTIRIYSIPFSSVYKIIGRYCDENYYMNGTVSDAQREFILKSRK